jgi:hypothetical protein
MIHFSCKWCGKRYHAPARYAGRSEACKDCGKPVFVPKKSMVLGPPLLFACPRCGKRYRTSARHAGVKQACRGCGDLIAAPERPSAATASAGQPLDSPFELDPTSEAQKLAEMEAYLDLPPFELIPTADEFPDAVFVDEDAPEPVAAAKPPPIPPAPPPPPPVAALAPRPPVAAFVPPPPQAVCIPPPPPAPSPPPPAPAPPPVVLPAPAPVAPPPPPRMGDLPEAPLIEPIQEPLPAARPEKPKGCRHCGAQGSYNLHARSPLGVLAMLVGTMGGLAALCFVEEDWRYGLAAGGAFGIAIGGAFLKRWTIICSGCERRLY